MGTILGLIALGVAGGALAYAWLLRQDLEKASRRLDRYNRALYEANDEVRQLKEEMADELAQLQATVLRSGGQAAFRPWMTVRQAYALHPQAQEVLAAFHLGGCSSCAVEPDAQLDRICAASGVDVDQVVTTLNGLLPANGSSNPITEPQPVKLPNLSLEI